MHIRPINASDLPAVAAMLRELSLEFVVNDTSADVATRFTEAHDEAALRDNMHAGDVCYVAELDQALAGFISVREQRHIFHLFVSKVHHGKGIARALWEHARLRTQPQGSSAIFTVNSSNYAVPVYERLGFVRTAPTQCKNGIYFNPMQLDESAHA